MSEYTILSEDEQKLLDAHGAELLDLEERYGTQQAVLDARPDLIPTAKAMQMRRAENAAAKMGLGPLRGDGRPFPADVLADCQRVFAAIVRAQDA